MLKHLLPAAAALALLAPHASAQTATPGVSLVIRDGKVTLKAEQRPSAKSWPNGRRQGQVKVVGADKLVGAPVTLTIIDLPEKQALEIVMRGVPGYMAVDRVRPGRHPVDPGSSGAGPSRFDRVIVMARAATRSRPPRVVAWRIPRHAVPGPAAGGLPRPCGDAAGLRAAVGATRHRLGGPERNDVEQFQQVEPPMPDAPVANAYPGSPTSGATSTARPVRGQPCGGRRGRHHAAPPETQFDYANPQKILRAAPAAAASAAAAADVVPTSVPTMGTPLGTTAPCADRDADRRPDGSGFARPAWRRAATAGRPDAGPGRVLQPVQPARRLGAAAAGAGQRHAGRAGPRQVQQPVQPLAAARVTPSDAESLPHAPAAGPPSDAAPVSGEYAARGDYHRAPDPAWDYLPTYLAKLERVRGWLNALPPAAGLDPAAAKRPSSRSSPGAWRSKASRRQLLFGPVQRGSLLRCRSVDGRFPRALCIDARNTPTRISPRALAELRRVAPRRQAVVSVPNSPTCSRACTSCSPPPDSHGQRVKHPGDRPLAEYRRLFDRAASKWSPNAASSPPSRSSRPDPPQARRSRLAARTLTRVLPWPSLSFLSHRHAAQAVGPENRTAPLREPHGSLGRDSRWLRRGIPFRAPSASR